MLHRGPSRGGDLVKRIALALALALSVVVVAGGSALAATSKSSFQVFVEPTISAASNGLTLETEFEGTFNVANKSASGSGSYAVSHGISVVVRWPFSPPRR